MRKHKKFQGRSIITQAVNEYYYDAIEGDELIVGSKGIDYGYDYYSDGSICLYEYYSDRCKCDYCTMVRNISRETRRYEREVNKKAASRLSDIFFTNFFA